MLPWSICVVLCIMIVYITIKKLLLKRNVQKLFADFEYQLSLDSNTLLSINTSDKSIRYLADKLNKQLRSLRELQHQYANGDMELKHAITNISHDLRTPLTAIQGYLELLELEAKSDNVNRYIEIIQGRSETLKQLTSELFQYTMASTQLEKDRDEVVINVVLEECIAIFYSSLMDKHIVPHIQITENAVVRSLNRLSLARIFSNIIQNAIQHSDGDLDIDLLESGEIIFSNRAHQLNELQVAKLFDRFYTVESNRKSTGLGLAIARTLVEQMNGTIHAELKNSQLSICVCFPKT